MSGRPGIGKTALVEEHCRREFKRGLVRYPAGVFWLDGHLTASILTGLRNIASETLKLVPPTASEEDTLNVALGYLMVAKGWLVGVQELVRKILAQSRPTPSRHTALLGLHTSTSQATLCCVRRVLVCWTCRL